MEVGITENMADLVNSGEILALAQGDYLLVETPYYSLPLGMDEIISGLREIGKTVILAHPERSKELQENPNRILELVDSGAWVQITAGSLSGSFGERAKRCALEFAKLGALDIVASDAHSARRRPVVSGALEILAKEIGSQKVDTIIENTYKVIGANYCA